MKYLYTLACLLLVGACNGSSESNTADTAAVQQVAEKRTPPATGKVIDTINCTAGQSYALYVPTTYQPDQPMPLLLCFDAHARGSLPVRAYRQLAEETGCIIAGSNTSKNGMEINSSVQTATTMLADIRSRLNIDAGRVYACGFSGGARVASAVAVISGGIAGVIGCGAGFAQLPQKPAGKFHFVGVAGDADFNLPELLVLNEQLQQAGFPHTFIPFRGRHAWPTAGVFRLALYCLINDLNGKGNGDMHELAGTYATQLAAEGKPAAAVRFLDEVVASTKANAANTVLQQQSSTLTASSAYRQQLAEEQKVRQDESRICQELGARVMSEDLNWWRHTYDDLKAKAAGTGAIAGMYRRAISYLGFVAFMATSRSVQSGDMKRAVITTQLFRMLDAQNPDGWYLEAVNLVHNNKIEEALAALKKCAEAGYNQPADILADPQLASVRALPSFTGVIERIRNNYLAASTQ
jgi:hypothetical protein